MFTRSKTRTVNFQRPFTLSGLGGMQPPGDYQVQDDEEQIPGIAWLAYRRVATLIDIISGPTISRIAIDNADLQAAIDKDRAIPFTRVT